eukprot:scaffold8287_cov28-Phaeocystis_antarctica.AAC.2
MKSEEVISMNPPNGRTPPQHASFTLMVHFFGASRQASDHVVVARLHAPGRLGTSQLSNPRTQWMAPSAQIA